MKRLSAPKFWMLPPKEKKFAVTPMPGAHGKKKCIPLLVLLRDILGYAADAKEAKVILNKGLVMIDGKKRKDRRYPAGLMDIVSAGDEHYRIVPGKRGLVVRKIKKEEAAIKLLQIKNKTVVRKNKIQINCHDGRNIIDNAKCKTGDTIVFDIIGKRIKDILPFQKGAHAIITAGHNTGAAGIIEKIIERPGSKPNEVILAAAGEKITVPQRYLFVTGKDKPVIATGGAVE